MEEPEKKHKKPVLRIVIFSLLAFAILVLALAGITAYRWILKPNVEIRSAPVTCICIPTGSGFSRVRSILYDQNLIINHRSFEWVAKWKDYDTRVKPGRYRIQAGMSNNDLVNLLRSGKQEPVRLIFNSLVTREELAGRISRQIEADSVTLLRKLNDPAFLQQYHVKPSTVFVLFIPNTYEFYWNTSAEQFFSRMYREQKEFWTPARINKSSTQGHTITQVVTLASIIERETAKDAEKPSIAGVYLNRMKKNWPLQADPTLIFAWNDYSIRRVLDRHKLIQSPYNTYIHTGLPPGPLCLPSIASIDAVLNPARSGYMYMCAKDDQSGYHVFAETLPEHIRNAKKYQESLKKAEQRKKNGN